MNLVLHIMFLYMTYCCRFNRPDLVFNKRQLLLSRLHDIEITVTAAYITFTVRSSEPLYNLSPGSEIAKLVTYFICSLVFCKRWSKPSFTFQTFRSREEFASELILHKSWQIHVTPKHFLMISYFLSILYNQNTCPHWQCAHILVYFPVIISVLRQKIIILTMRILFFYIL